MSEQKIEVKWQADDGYVGNRKHCCSIDPAEFDADMTDDEIADLIRQIVEDDFQQRVSCSYSDDELNAAVQRVRAALVEGSRRCRRWRLG